MAGVGSAINDTSREVGGTLGVAIIGSIFATTYGPKIVELLTPFGLPEQALSAAEESVGAAFFVAEQAGEPTATAAIQNAASLSFLDGFQVACTTEHQPTSHRRQPYDPPRRAWSWASSPRDRRFTHPTRY
jgi:hypothetical protein